MTKAIEKGDYSVRQLAELLGCSVGTIKNRIRSGYIKTAGKLLGGQHWRIPYEEVERIKAEMHAPETKGEL